MNEICGWKPSFFNVFLSDAGNEVLFNSATGRTLATGDGRREILRDCFHDLERTGTHGNIELLEGLVALGFAVPADHDEYAQARDRLGAHIASREKLFLTIAPTMGCNMRCSYCFQRDTPKTKTMSPDIQDGVIEFVRRKAPQSRRLVVQWFGGEPLIAFDVIVRLSEAFQEICRAHGLHYHAEMLTNGMLLTPARIKALSALAVRALQIPLDGKPETYAERREVSPRRAKAYYRFLIENMPALLDATGSVTIRINVDRDNADEARDVVAAFKRGGIVDPRLDFRLGFLNTSRGMVECIPHDCFTNPEFAEQEHEFRSYLAEQGYMVFGMPQPRDHPCTAILRNAFTIDPAGGIGKCVPATGTGQSRFARIRPDDMEKTLEETEAADMPYAGFDPFLSHTCTDCRLLPVCLGSCPKLHQPDVSFACSMKEGLERKMLFYHAFHDQHETLSRRVRSSAE